MLQNVRYREFIEVKAEKRRLDVDLQDTRDELQRLIREDKQNKTTIQDLTGSLEDKQAKSDKLQQDLAGIKADIDSVLGGVR